MHMEVWHQGGTCTGRRKPVWLGALKGWQAGRSLMGAAAEHLQ